jgi:catechol 2,3-dioxygenase-like lactoylglutathione lyase family enzyme
MALHRLTSVTIGVSDVAETGAYYAEFGLIPDDDGWFRTRDAGRQLRLVTTPTRRLVELRIGVDDQDDIDRAVLKLDRLGIEHASSPGQLIAMENATGVRAVLEVAARVSPSPVSATIYNGPGRYERQGERAAGLLRTERVAPRKLGHVVVGSPDFAITKQFFTDGLGFKVSDHIKDAGVFLRCSIDHHNLLVLAAPLSFLHHTSWQVDDIDEVGRGAYAMLEDHPERHVWGLGRHYAGSNFFWYLKDPAGNFSEYYSDMDCIIDDQLWTPEILEGAKGLFSWGQPPPPSFLHPDDLAALMTGAHSMR